MAKLKSSLVGIFCVLSIFLIFPLQAFSPTEELDIEQQIEMEGDLNMIEARNSISVAQQPSTGNVVITFKEPIGMVEITVAQVDGNDYYTRRCYTVIERTVTIHMADAPPATEYELRITDSTGKEVFGSFSSK